MGFQFTVRLPLREGTSALGAFACGAYIFLPGTALILALVTWLGWSLPLSFRELALLEALGIIVSSWLSWALLVTGAFVLGTYESFRFAWRERATDLLIDRTGVAVEGGDYDGVFIRWEELDAPKTRVAERQGKHVLVLERVAEAGSPGAMEIALGTLEEERGVLEALATTFRELGGERESTSSAIPSMGIPIFRCPACGEAAIPDDVETVGCTRCREFIAVPPDVRKRIAIHRTRARELAPAVIQARALLTRRDARTTNALLAFAAVPTLAAWAVASAALGLQYHRETLTALNVVLLVAGVSVLAASPLWLLRVRLANRTVLRALSFELGAPASAPRPVCRRCGALLPNAAADSMGLVLCVYCNAENLIGVGLRAWHDTSGRRSGRRAWPVRQRRPNAATLEQILRGWHRERARFGVCAAVSLALIPVAAWAVSTGLSPLTDKAKALVDCREGRWEGCVRAGELEENDRQTGTGARALRLYEQACRATDDIGCFELARMLREARREVPRDYSRALDLFTHLCDKHDHAAACSSEGLMRWLGEGITSDRAAAHLRFARACQGSDAFGCFIEATIFAEGELVTRDASRAVDLHRRACGLGSDDACNALADALEVGDGIAKDLEGARRLRQTACDRGSHTACSFVADALLVSGKPDDRAHGTLLLRRGCNEAQDARSCWRLGRFYINAGVDGLEGEKYLEMGCSFGLKSSCMDFAVHSAIGPQMMKDACARGLTQACLPENYRSARTRSNTTGQ